MVPRGRAASRLAASRGVVGIPTPVAGQRRFPWAEQMARQLQTALSELALSPAETLAGVYLSTDASPCDAENRLFVNPAECIPKASRPCGLSEARVRPRRSRCRYPRSRGTSTTTDTVPAARGVVGAR
jgi:hypothetical protein